MGSHWEAKLNAELAKSFEGSLYAVPKMKVPLPPMAPPGLEMVSVDMIDDPFWVLPGEPGSQKQFRNVHVRMRLHESVETTPPVVIKLWNEFFELWGKAKPNLNSDILLALSQKMFEIEEARKAKETAKPPIPVVYGKGMTQQEVPELPPFKEPLDQLIKAMSSHIDKSMIDELLMGAHGSKYLMPTGLPLDYLFKVEKGPPPPDEYELIEVTGIDGTKKYIQGMKK